MLDFLVMQMSKVNREKGYFLFQMRGQHGIMEGVYNYHDSQPAHLRERILIGNSVGMELVTRHQGGSLKYSKASFRVSLPYPRISSPRGSAAAVPRELTRYSSLTELASGYVGEEIEVALGTKWISLIPLIVEGYINTTETIIP